MNRIRTLIFLIALGVALGAMAQQTSTMPSVDDHMKFLTAQLSLTADQQSKLRPIVKEMQDSAEQVRQDQQLSEDQRHEKLRTLHAKAIKNAKQYLTSEQQQKLDTLMNNPHPDMHEKAQ